MRAEFLVFLCVLISAGNVTAQSPSGRSTSDVRIEALRPTVFLEVEKLGGEHIEIRLQNNSNVNIAVRTSSFYLNDESLRDRNPVSILPSDKEIRTLHCYVERSDPTSQQGCIPKVSYPHSSFDSWILAGKSIHFVVPTRWLKPGLSIYVPFQYEWELSEQLIFNNEPKHRVYFRGVDLPKR